MEFGPESTTSQTTADSADMMSAAVTGHCDCVVIGFAGAVLRKNRQKAQLPLRNRASAMHFFAAKLRSIAVMNYAYVFHLRNLGPMIRLSCYAHSE